MHSEQFGPLFLKSVVTISINTPQGTRSSNCQMGAEAARALNGKKIEEGEKKKKVTCLICFKIETDIEQKW